MHNSKEIKHEFIEPEVRLANTIKSEPSEFGTNEALKQRKSLELNKMTRPSGSSSSATEEKTWTGRIVSITPNDGRRLETCEILMKVSARTILKYM